MDYADTKVFAHIRMVKIVNLLNNILSSNASLSDFSGYTSEGPLNSHYYSV